MNLFRIKGFFSKRTLLILTVAELLFFGAAALMSYGYWGYAFYPPALPRLAQEATEIRSLGWFVINYKSADLQRSAHWMDLKATRHSPEDFRTSARALRFWLDRHVVAADANDVERETAQFLQRLIVQKFPAGALKSYNPQNNASFFIAEFKHPSLGPLYFINAKSGEFSNDRHFEMEGVVQKRDGFFYVLEDSSFNFDVAGLEDLDYLSVFIMLNVVFMGLLPVLYLLIVLARLYIRSLQRYGDFE